MSNKAPSSGEAEIVSWSKDSISVRWRFDSQQVDDDIDYTSISGFMLRYQAVGSLVIQHTRLLDPSTTDYDITQLHENTNYDICVLRVRNFESSLTDSSAIIRPVVSALLSPTSLPVLDTVGKACIKGTTSTDSLSVALGSTFGAFLALGLIVALVFVAKCQHVRRVKKRLEKAIDGASQEVAEIEDVMLSRIEDQRRPDDTGVLVPLVSNGGELVANGNDHQVAANDDGTRVTSAESSRRRSAHSPATGKQGYASIEMSQISAHEADTDDSTISAQSRQVVVSLEHSSVLEDSSNLPRQDVVSLEHSSVLEDSNNLPRQDVVSLEHSSVLEDSNNRRMSISTQSETTPSDGCDSIQTTIHVDIA